MKHIVFAILLAAAVATAPSMWAQNQSVRLTETQWKAVEGIYRNWQNSDMNLRFEGHGVFYNEAQSYPLAIVLGADGKVKSIMILSSQEFDKVPE